MKVPPTPPNEDARLEELWSLNILDSDIEERFDHVTRLAQRLFGVPYAAITLIDRDRQWLKSQQGLGVAETSRKDAFCAWTILSDTLLYVPDTTKDDRFNENPFVVGDPNIRFYAGYPITGPHGNNLGSLCVMDTHARQINELDRASLQDLAQVVEKEMAALQLATVDQLTGLSNRRGFEFLASKSLKLARRHAIPATLLYFDVDKLKETNDRCGHAIGDELLRTFAHLLENIYRESDIVARVGGDEFVVLLSATNDVERALQRFNERRLEGDERSDSFVLDASVGGAAFDPATPISLLDLVNKADAAMYVAKQSKNNR